MTNFYSVTMNELTSMIMLADINNGYSLIVWMYFGIINCWKQIEFIRNDTFPLFTKHRVACQPSNIPLYSGIIFLYKKNIIHRSVTTITEMWFLWIQMYAPTYQLMIWPMLARTYHKHKTWWTMMTLVHLALYTVLCCIKVNSNIIELTSLFLHPDFLCVRTLKDITIWILIYCDANP